MGRFWQRVLTAGLPVEERRRRIAEVNSYLADHEASLRAADASTLRVEARMASALLRGLPADLLWRCLRSPSPRLIPGLGLFLALTYWALAAIVTFVELPLRAPFNFWNVALPALVLGAGAWFAARSRALGPLLLFAVPLAVHAPWLSTTRFALLSVAFAVATLWLSSRRAAPDLD